VSDAYRVLVCEAGRYRFSLCADGGNADFDTWLCLLNEGGGLVADNGNSFKCDGLGWLDQDLARGTYYVAVSGVGTAAGTYTLSFSSLTPGVENYCEGLEEGRHLLGDCNGDGALDIADAVCVFSYLFLGERLFLPCGSGTLSDPANLFVLDHNGDGGVDVSDGIATLVYLFQGGAPHVRGTDCVAVAGCPGVCGERD
jgi:hypothetical protein